MRRYKVKTVTLMPKKTSLVSVVRRKMLGNDSGALTFNMTGHVWRIVWDFVRALSLFCGADVQGGTHHMNHPTSTREWNMEKTSNMPTTSLITQNSFVLKTPSDFWNQISRECQKENIYIWKRKEGLGSLRVDFGCHTECLIALPYNTLHKWYVSHK